MAHLLLDYYPLIFIFGMVLALFIRDQFGRASSWPGYEPAQAQAFSIPQTPQPRPKLKNRRPPKQEPPRPKAGKRVQWLAGRLSHIREVQLDEHCSHRLAQRIRRHRISVVMTNTGRMKSSGDDMQLAEARKNRRVLITRDKGFLVRHRRGEPHSGIIHAPSGEEWNQEIVRVLLREMS